MALALAVSLVVQNAVAMVTDPPTYAAPMTEVLAYHSSHRGAVAIAVGLEALNLPLLLGFLSGLHGFLARRGGAGTTWSRCALAAAATLSAVFAVYAVAWIAVVLTAAQVTEPSPTLQLAWQMHAAAFALALPALGTTFAGAAWAAHRGGLTPSWQRLLGLIGGAVLIVTGAASLSVADGSPVLFVGLPGYAAWIVWLIVTGLRLIRARKQEPISASPGGGPTLSSSDSGAEAPPVNGQAAGEGRRD